MAKFEVGEDGGSMDTEQLDETLDRVPLFIRDDQAIDVIGSETTKKRATIWLEPRFGSDVGPQRLFRGANALVKNPNKGTAGV